ncbi:PREDICTED: regulatory solute carrier protein family 1 member 1 isoform X2 [Ficedula albicollis]|nr:PREDICTED: regulatory solute carrier protein family 1 member 1 isoform X2 [Ficedula albicollis]
MPSLPASDGCQNPVQSSGLNSKICNPTNQLLDRSVSAPASICSSESSLAEPIDPRTVSSSPEHQKTPEEEQPLVSQHHSNSSSLANNDPSPHTGDGTCSNPACLSQKTLKETFSADILKDCNAKGQDREHPLEVTEVNLDDTAAKHRQDKDICLSSEQEQKHELPTDYRMCKEPEKEHLEQQTETTDPEPPCCVGGVEKPAVAKAKQPENPPMEMRDGLERAGLSCLKGSIQLSASCSHVHMEASMEIDAVEQAAAEAQSSARQQKQQTENRHISNLNSEAFSMEVELLKSPSSLSHPVSTSDVLQSKSTSEIPVEYHELANLAADSSSPSSTQQLETDPGRPSEELCFPLASALKELHKLLVISRKGECKILASDEVSRLEMAHREPAVQQKGLPEGEQKGSDPASQEQSCSFTEASSEGGGAEGSQPCDSGREHISPGPVRPGQPVLGGDALERQKSSGKSNVFVVSSAATPGQQQSPEQREVLARGSQSPPSPTSEQSTPVSSTSASGEGAPQDTQSLFTGAPGGSGSAAPEGLWPVGGSEEPPLSPPPSSTRLTTGASPSPAFPVADVDRILGAGFTPQEALQALEQAGGNADLALLILLAKSIVVPT